MAYPPRLAWLWSGLAVGAVATGGLALWQKVILGAFRADGHTQVIQFGNISLLLGMFCLAGLGWAWAQKSRYIWLGILTFGAMGGLLGSLLSGSRAMLSVTYVDFSLTQGFLTHNSGVMLYAFWMVILWGCLRHYHRCRLDPA